LIKVIFDKYRSRFGGLQFLASIILIITLLSSPAGAAVRAGEKPIVLRLSTFVPPAHPASKLFKDFAKELETTSKGRVNVEYYGTSSLGKAAEQYEITVEGLADLATTCCAYAGSRFPLALGVQLPLFADSADRCQDYYDHDETRPFQK